MTYYKIQPGILHKSICGEHLLIGTGDAYSDSVFTRQLNPTGVFFWSLLEQQMELEEMIKEASIFYKVDKERIRPGLLRFLDELVECGFLRIEKR